ncbi:hypothetical protein Taro_042653 [Colocasia esculenta]|uniref:Retrotransposon gag domain-containing protein n=1 Tax=Colocasia esculenta TaxID=4460 RepID=A0A843WQ51_COLES|nr:hypothetical protein [Colocasia esculenta]
MVFLLVRVSRGEMSLVVMIRGLVQAMPTQAHTQAALQAQLEAQQAQLPRLTMVDPPSWNGSRGCLHPFKGESDPLLAESWMREIKKMFWAIRCAEDDKVTLATYMLQERADVWWSSILRTRFEDGAMDKFGSMTMLEYEAKFAELSKYAPYIVADEHRKAKKFVMGLRPSLGSRLVAFDHRTLEQALNAACRQEGEMEQYLEEKKVSQKRLAAPFQRQDRKKAAFQSPQCPVASGSSQVSSQRSPSGKKECPHCGRTHGGSECWKMAGKCLKCERSEHKI